MSKAILSKDASMLRKVKQSDETPLERFQEIIEEKYGEKFGMDFIFQHNFLQILPK